MRRLQSCAALAALFAASGCGKSHSVDEPNPAIAPAVNEAASTIGRTDGREAASPPITPAEAGAVMRSSAAERPTQRP